MLFFRERPLLILALLLLGRTTVAQVPTASGQTKSSSKEMVLVEAEAVTPAAISQWKNERFNGVAVVLNERTGKAAYGNLARRISEAGLDVYWWIEVGRNPQMASEHPRWMAGLGMHEDWQKRFPKFPEPGAGEVAKAFPWVPIRYVEAFDAHLLRISQLLQRVPDNGRGLLLNDLQGGPSSCGCGNVLCRWAIDYHVPPTATHLKGDDFAAQFVAEVRKRAANKAVIPIWTTECETVDLPAGKNQGRPGTGLCGTIGCATGACPIEFAQQFSALSSANDGPIGLLGLHAALQRTQKELGGGPGWLTNAVAYLERTLPAPGGKAISRDRLWVVVEGSHSVEESASRELAAKMGAGAVIVARTTIDQSYEPRMVRTK